MKGSKQNITLCILAILSLNILVDEVKAQPGSIINGFSLAQSLQTEFTTQEIEIEKGQIISNVMKVINTSNDSLSFFITMNLPPLWKTLTSYEREYFINPNDSIFIPVRIIPAALMKGDTKYYITVYIEDEKRRQVKSEYFFASTPRISSWELIAKPSNRIYLRNNETMADFDLTLRNTGNEKQDLMMSLGITSSNVLIMDTTEKPVKDLNYDLTLESTEDTTFKFKVKHVEAVRNFKNIDIDNYVPGGFDKERHFSLFVHTEEPRREKYNNLSQSAKVDFVKLTNDKKVNPFGSDVLPLTAFLRVNNILDDVVFSSLHLRGQKFLNNGGNLIYNASFYFSSLENYYGPNYVKNIPWYIGYFDRHKNLQVGFVNGGAIGVQSSGKGVKGEIEFLPDHWAGGYYIRTPYLFSTHRLESFGFHHRMTYDKFTNTTQYSRTDNKYADIKTDVISVTPKVKIAQKHNLNFIGAFSNRNHYANRDSTYNRTGYLVGAGYTSAFFNAIWRLNIRGTYTSKGFGAYGYERIIATHRSRIRLAKHLEISVNNNLNRYNYDPEYYSYIPGYDRNTYLFNNLIFHSKKFLGYVQPGVFYDIRDQWGNNFHSRGLYLGINKYDISQNLQASLITTVGFNRIVNEPGSDEHFMLKLNSMIRYRNFSFNGFYNYGPISPEMIHVKEQTDIVPQTVRTSFIHMYMFKNRHTALQSRLSYMYTNIYKHHSLNISPEFFYFTNTGWRFSINPIYTFYSSKIRGGNYELPGYVNQQDFEFRRYSNDNFMISLSVKKDFGIPIPGTFSEFSDIQFTAFYDLDGNRLQDPGEPGIENVVISAGDSDVITNSSGNASFKNASPGRFEWEALSLEDLGGWFPVINDTLIIYKDEEVLVPFVKGVKISGSVYIEQEMSNLPEDKKLDISGIKITASNGKSYHTLTGSNGGFEFYLPFGEYTISLDETVLNGRFYLLKNNFKLDLSQQVENMFLTFHIVERKRTVRIKKFNVNGEEQEE